ncbi:MAG: hypothetical protein ACJ75D_10730, partial [Gaiellaceae bacterium]
MPDPNNGQKQNVGKVIEIKGVVIDAVFADLAAVVDRLAEDVEETPQRRLADGDGDGRAGIDHVDP